jgi:galactokinase/mevalonate kinase-like predicted kinase
MLSYNIKMGGFDRLTDGTTGEIAEKVIAEANEDMAVLMREFVHVMSGETRESIRVEGNAVVAGEGAVFEELGTIYRSAHPFMLPAFDIIAPQIPERIGSALREAGRRW